MNLQYLYAFRFEYFVIDVSLYKALFFWRLIWSINGHDHPALLIEASPINVDTFIPIHLLANKVIIYSSSFTWTFYIIYIRVKTINSYPR